MRSGREHKLTDRDKVDFARQVRLHLNALDVDQEYTDGLYQHYEALDDIEVDLFSGQPLQSVQRLPINQQKDEKH